MMTDRRYLAVDRRNLFAWLSRGLIVPRALMPKYRPDALDSRPNALPIAADTAAPLLAGPAEYPVCVELVPQVDVEPATDGTDNTVVWARGALSARRIARVHVRTPGDADEIQAREYRGFDAGRLDISVTPTLFPEEAGNEQEYPAAGEIEAPNDQILKRREAVAGAVMSMFSRQAEVVQFPNAWFVRTETEDPVWSLAQVAKSSGLITRADDTELLHATLTAIYEQSERGDIVASTLLAEIGQTASLSETLGIKKHLERILELTSGEEELKPFKSKGGLLTTKALLLYLLRLDPEAVRGWADEELNVEPEVLQLSRMLAGFAARYGGLPSSLRVGPPSDALLDWVAKGLQPSDFTLSIDDTQETPTYEAASHVYTNPAVDALRQDYESGKQDEALAVAKALGWDDCLQLKVTADSFNATTTDGQVHVTFPPGSVPIWALTADPFLNRLSELTDTELQSALKSKPAARRRTPTKAARGTTARSTAQPANSEDPPDDPDS
jgi:hypothetical protein